MKIIFSKSNDAAVNLAGEEYLFNNFTDDIFYLYVNAPSIIVGRKQNTLAEISIDFVKEKNIKVIRRMTGGGAVFHDLGNLNFCFICRNQENMENNFEKYTRPILDYLQSLGVNAILDGRNDLTIDGKKFSGNAKFFSNRTLLQHGTILFSSSLSNLSAALKADPSKFDDKAVKSVQSRVTNVYEQLPTKIAFYEFATGLIKFIGKQETENMYDLTDADLSKINELVTTKYDTWEWNFGKSPAYDFTKSIRTKGGTLKVSLVVKDGYIKICHFYGDFFAKKDIDEYEKYFENIPHKQTSIESVVSSHPASEYFINITDEEIVATFS
jgi:lipoate-protein ligase A